MWVVSTASACLLALALCNGQENTRWSRPVDERIAGDWIPLTNDQLGQASARALAQPLPQQNHLFGQQGSFGQQQGGFSQQQISSDAGKYIGNGAGFHPQDFLQPRFPQSLLPQQLPPQFLNQQFGSPFSNPFGLGQSLLREPFIGQQDHFIPPPPPPPPPPSSSQSLPPPPADQPLSSNLKPNENYYNRDSGLPFDQIENSPPKKSLQKRPTTSQSTIPSEIGSHKAKDERDKEEVQILYVPVETLKNQRGRGNKGIQQQDQKPPSLEGLSLQQEQRRPSNYDSQKNFGPSPKLLANFAGNQEIPPNFESNQNRPHNFGVPQKAFANFAFDQSGPPNFGLDERNPSNFGSAVSPSVTPSSPTPLQPVQERQKESKKFRHPIQPLASQKPAYHLNTFSEFNSATGHVKTKKNQDTQNEYDNQRDNTQLIPSSPVIKNALPETTPVPTAQETQPYTLEPTRYSRVKAQEKEPDEFYNPHFSEYLTESKQGQTTKRIPLLQKHVNSNIEDNTRGLPPPNQPPLSVYMETNANSKVGDVLSLLKDAKTIPVLDTIGPESPQVFVGPSNLKPPHGYVKFELPYLSSLDGNRVEHKVLQLPFFVAPLNFQPPPGYSKIPFPPPHIGSVVLSNNTPKSLQQKESVTPNPLIHQTTSYNSAYTIPADISSISPQLPSLINNLQVDEKYNGLSTTQEVIPETTVVPVLQENPLQHSRRPLHRGGQRHSQTTTESVEFTTTRRPARQRRPFTSRNSGRQTTTPSAATTTTTEAYEPTEGSEYHDKKQSEENYMHQQQQHRVDFPPQLANDPYQSNPIQNSYDQPGKNTPQGNLKTAPPYYSDDERKELRRQQYDGNNYRGQVDSRFTPSPAYEQGEFEETAKNNGNTFVDYSFASNIDPTKHHYEQDEVKDSTVTSTESINSDAITSPRFRNGNGRPDQSEYTKTTPQFVDFLGDVDENRDTKYYSQGPFAPTPPNEQDRRPIPHRTYDSQGPSYNTPQPSDYQNNQKFTESLNTRSEQPVKQRVHANREHGPSDLKNQPEERPEKVQIEDDSPPNKDYFLQFNQGNPQLKPYTSKPSLEAVYQEKPTEQQYEDYITTENQLKSLTQTTLDVRDAISTVGINRDTPQHFEEEKRYQHPRFRTRTQIATKAKVDEEKENYASQTPPTQQYYSTETTTTRSTERSRVRGRVRGRGSYAARPKTTTEPPNYPSIPIEREQKEVTHSYDAIKIEETPSLAVESNDSEYNTVPSTEATTRTVTNKYSHSRTASRRPLRPSYRVSTTPSTTTSVTSSSPPGVKYLIRTRRPPAQQSIQTKLSPGRSRIRRPTAPTTTTTEPATEAPKVYNTQYPSQANDEEENKLKYYSQTIERLEQTPEPKTEIPRVSDSMDYKPVTGDFDPNGNIKFVHNIKSSTSSYLNDDHTNDDFDSYTPSRNVHKEQQHPVYSKRPYLSPKKNFQTTSRQEEPEEIKINFKTYDQPEISTSPFYEDLRQTTRKVVQPSAPQYEEEDEEVNERPNPYEKRKKIHTTPRYEDEPVTIKQHSPRRGHRFHEADATNPERINNHRQSDHQPRELTKSEKQKEAEDFWNQAVTIQQSKSYEYEPDSPIFSTPGPATKSSKDSKNEYDYDDYFNVPEQGKYDKAVSDQSPFPSNDQQFTYTGLKPQGETGKENQYPEKLVTAGGTKSQVDEESQELEDKLKDREMENIEKPVDEEQHKMSSRSDVDLELAPVTPENDFSSTSKRPSRRRGTWVRVKVKKLRDVFETAESQSFGSLSANSIPAFEKEKPIKTNSYKESNQEDQHSSEILSTETPENENSYSTEIKLEQSSTKATTDYFNAEEATEIPSFTTGTEAVAPDTTTITPLEVLSTKESPIPPWESKVLGTSTTTEISLETEICYRGRCVKTRRAQNKPVDTSDLITTD